MGNCPTCSTEEANKNLDPVCGGQRKWTVFLLSPFVVYFSILMIMLIHEKGRELVHRFRSKSVTDIDEAVNTSCRCTNNISDWAKSFISGKTALGKTFVVVRSVCNIASLVLYCIDTKYSGYMESCTPFRKSIHMQIDFGLNVVFLISFCLRFTVSKNKRRFWLSSHAFADIFTIVPSFVSVYLNRSWIGLRFLRSLPIMNTSDILQYMGVIERPRTIRIIKLASNFIAVWFAAAGLVYLVENSGDFFCNFCNAQELDIFNAVYFMIVTMATVGYGDFTCKTFLGKFFVLLFLMGGLAVFATMIPEFSSLFGSTNPYAGHYKRVKSKRHAIICGHITSHSLETFLQDFLHKGRDQSEKLDVLIIDRKTPTIEMEALLKRYYTKVHYFVGSIMNIADLQRVHANKATTCFIIANKERPDPDSDDSANIMRVISLKNFNQRIRIILQLLDYCNKMNVVSIPGWNADEDEIICIAELKLGLIGMSCVVPGFSTMMTNIFRMSSYNTLATERKYPICCCSQDNPYECVRIEILPKSLMNNWIDLTIKQEQNWPWRALYYRGAGMEMYLKQMSPSFYGKTYTESALICFKLRVMLLAVEMERADEQGHTRMAVDIIPCDDSIIRPGCRAFVVGLSSEDANRVTYYCSICHPALDKLTVTQLRRMKRCSHQESSNSRKEDSLVFNATLSEDGHEHAVIHMSDTDVNQPLLLSQQLERKDSACLIRDKGGAQENVSDFDSTGMFYFTPSRKIEDALIDISFLRISRHSFCGGSKVHSRMTVPKHPVHFKNHVIICLHADKSSPVIGLQNLVMPLRASSFRRQELPIIVFVTDIDYIRKEWDLISTFPDIYILNGSPINPYNLKLISIQNCRQCVIMSTLDRGNTDKYLVDKSSVLSALSIRQIEMKSAGFISALSFTRKSKIDSDMNESKRPDYHRIQTLTALTIDSNVQYVEQGYTDEVDLKLFLTTPFASGAAFADSVLDCILSCVYYNENAVNLLRNMLVGGIDLPLEEILAEGKYFVQCEAPEVLRKRNRARVAMLDIHELIPDIDMRPIPVTFNTLFCESLERHRMIVMGIYRLLDLLLQRDPKSTDHAAVDSPKRIVLYYPPYNYEMHPTDMVYVMQHSHLKVDSIGLEGGASRVNV